MANHRYNDYYLVNDEDAFVEDDFPECEYRPKKKCNMKRIFCISSIMILILASIAFVLVFIVFPLIFKYSVSLQENLVFTRWNLVSNKTYYESFRFPGLKNHYVPVRDLDNKTFLHLGLWHILPFDLAKIALQEESYDYDGALRNSNYSVLLYFHGTGEDRSQSTRKYQLFRYFFHVITFDYRGYGDSDTGKMFEKNVVHDCIQVFNWVRSRTNAPIYMWGHSLGTSLATSTSAHLSKDSNIQGLILESAFTTFQEELYHHPYVKYFKWLPWFKETIVKPLEKNGFIFDTSHNILNVSSPIMFLHAKDDKIVPYFMSEKLYAISETRNVDEGVKNDSMLILFDKKLDLSHYFIYQDPYVIFFIDYFTRQHSRRLEIFLEGSHQS